MADQTKELENSINDLTEIIIKLNEPVGGFKIDWNSILLTPRQIGKKIMAAGAPIINDGEGNEIPTDMKSIHTIVYGKYLEENGTLIDNEIKRPDCVDKNRGMSLTHPLFTEKVKNMVTDLKNSYRILKIKEVALADAFKLASKQIVSGALVLADALLPPSPKPTVGLTAIQSIVAAISTLMASVMEIIPLLAPLLNIPLILLDSAINVMLSGINVTLQAIIAILNGALIIKQSFAPIILLAG